MSVSTPDPALGDRTRAVLNDIQRTARYRWAAAASAGRRVLDVGCGPEGETALLRGSGAMSLTAVLRSDAAAELAHPVLGAHVSCEVADPVALPYADGAFDLVLAFGMLAGTGDPAALLDELARVLAPDGVLLTSLPGSGVSPNAVGPSSDQASLRSLVEQRWPAVISAEQRIVLASVAGDPSADAVVVGPTPAPTGATISCTLLMAGDRSAPPVAAVTFGTVAPVQAWLDDSDRSAAILAAQADELDELRSRDERGADARRRLAAAEQRVARLAAAEAERDDARRDLRATQERLQQTEERLERTTGELTGLRASRSWRLTAPLRWAQRRRAAR